jgi:hypothetical protein
MTMTRLLTVGLTISLVLTLGEHARCDTFYDVALDTGSLVGHPAGPFYLELAVTDGSSGGDGNNTVTFSNIGLGGGSALGSPIVFGGASGSLETGIGITDTSFLSVFSEQFAPGLQLRFTLGITSNGDAGGIPDGFTLYILDSSGVPLPTLAPAGEYFLAADIGASGPIFSAYGSDRSRTPSVGRAATIPTPTITPVTPVPEPSPIYLVGGSLFVTIILRECLSRSMADRDILDSASI